MRRKSFINMWTRRVAVYQLQLCYVYRSHAALRVLCLWYNIRWHSLQNGTMLGVLEASEFMFLSGVVSALSTVQTPTHPQLVSLVLLITPALFLLHLSKKCTEALLHYFIVVKLVKRKQLCQNVLKTLFITFFWDVQPDPNITSSLISCLWYIKLHRNPRFNHKPARWILQNT